jgi:predicted transcriptional regulator
MEKQTITIRVDSEKKQALDAIAAGMDRDRSYILNEAISAYLETHRWHLDHINEGLRQAKAGKFASEKEVARAFSRWQK